MLDRKSSFLLAAAILAMPVSGFADRPSSTSTDDGEGEFAFQPALYIVGGLYEQQVIDGSGGSSFTLEIATNSPLKGAAFKSVRHALSVGVSTFGSTADSNGLSAFSLELNNYYMKPIASKLKVGVGLGLGYLRVKQDALADPFSASSAQIATLIEYRKSDRWSWTAELRHQLTGELVAEINEAGVPQAPVDTDLPNTRLLLKLGYNFAS